MVQILLACIIRRERSTRTQAVRMGRINQSLVEAFSEGWEAEMQPKDPWSWKMTAQHRERRFMVRHLNRLFEYWFAVRVAWWICVVASRLHLMAFPAFLSSLTSNRDRFRDAMGKERAVEIIVRVCHLSVFRCSFFPRICLRQSLALYRFLSLMGYPVQLHVGVHKDREVFRAHSWVSLYGQPVADEEPKGTFRTLLSYPDMARSFESPEQSQRGGYP